MGKLTKNIMGFFDVKGVVQDGFVSLRDYIRASIKNLTLYKCPCERGGGTCECEKDPDAPEEEPEEEPDEHGGGPDGGIGFRTVTPIADPSGYVYEAVPSNRVEGVTATVYEYKEIIETDDYGVETGRRKEEVKWDAENYDQINPQTTDAAGIFAWDVPEGLWVVKFTRDGYEDADSYQDVAATVRGENGKNYLPVPPIQTEINTAIVSRAKPEVSAVSAFEDEIRIDFSQYMQIGTVNNTNVTVKTADGKTVSGTLEPLNAEDNYEKTAQYASSFAFKPADPAKNLYGTVTVTVKNVKSYNENAIAAAYTGQHPVKVMPKDLAISGDEVIRHHETGSLTIQILPQEAGANKTLTVTSSSPSIVSAGAQTVTTDAKGKALVTLDGNLPGQGVLSVSLGDLLTKELPVRVLSDLEDAEVPGLKSIESDEYQISLSPDVFVYNAKEQKPTVTIEGLQAGTDFTVDYGDDTVNAGTKTVTISGTGGYTGTVTKEYTIQKASVSTAAISGIVSRTYTGRAVTQTPVVKLDGRTLTSGTDYSVTYTNNTKAGTASLTITGKGNYTGTAKKTFTIARAAQTLTVKAAAAVDVGKTTKIKASGAKETNKYTFTSSNTSVAAVSADGTVTGKKAGSVTITVATPQTANYSKGSKTLKITVRLVLKKPGNCHFVKWNNEKYNSCRLGWNKVDGATGYQSILSWTDGSHASTKILKSNVLSQDCSVTVNHVSQFKVRAFADTAAGRVYSPWSNLEYITPSPTKLTCKNASTAAELKEKISWNIIYGCNGYNVFLTTNPNGTWYWNQSTSVLATSLDATITKYRGSKLKKNTRYYVRIVTRRKRNGVFCTVPMPRNNTNIGSFIIK